MTIRIPARVRDVARGFGPEGDRWLRGLPDHVDALRRRWSLDDLEAMDVEGCTSWIGTCTLDDGTPAALKVIVPHEESRREADALSAYSGEGAVRVLRATEDGFTLLLERCVPGASLWSLSVDEGNDVLAGLLRRLWRRVPPDAPFRRLTDIVEDWCERMPTEAPAQDYDPRVARDAAALGRELLAHHTDEVLLHGDLHPGNVLAAEREPWLAIDPKPLVGDPAFDLAQLLINRCWSDPSPREIRRQTDRLAEATGLDRDRIAAWAAVKAVGWNCGPAVASLLDTARRR